MSTPRLTNSLKVVVEPAFLRYLCFYFGGTFFGRSESCFIAFASLARFTEITRHNIVIYFPHINPYEILSRVSLTVNEGSPHTPHPCSNCYLTSNSNEHIHWSQIFYLVCFMLNWLWAVSSSFSKPLNCFCPGWSFDWEEGNGGWGGGEEIREDNDKKQKRKKWK